MNVWFALEERLFSPSIFFQLFSEIGKNLEFLLFRAYRNARSISLGFLDQSISFQGFGFGKQHILLACGVSQPISPFWALGLSSNIWF